MKEKIKELEKIARRLEPGVEQRGEWNAKAQQHADRFLDQLPEAKAFRTTEGKGREILELDIREKGRPLDQLLAAVDRHVDHEGINPASGFHFGYVPGGGVFPSALGDYLGAVSNRYAGIFFANPGAVRMENQLIRWMCRLVSFPETALGNLASGGSIANLIAITAARDKHGIGPGKVQRAVIYLTRQTHHCVHKALRIAGLREATLRYIPMNEQFQMDAAALWEFVARDKAEGLIPFMVVASAGTTDTGAIDPLNDVADIAEEYGLWHHVDAAYGGFFLLVDQLKEKFRGIERADSIAIDPHKGLFIAYGLGAILIRDVDALIRSHRYQANYMQDALSAQEEPSPADLSPELTKHFRGLRMWLPLQLYGVEPFRAALEEKVWLCRYFHQKIQEAGFETGPEPELSITVFRYIPNEGDTDTFNRRLIELIKEDGRVFMSSTTIDGAFWIRMAVMSFRSHLHEVDTCLEIIDTCVRKLQAEAKGSGLSR